MAIKIRFDSTHNAELPTYVLASRNGRLLGKLPNSNVTFKNNFNAESTSVFRVYKSDCAKSLWDQIKDFKLVWAKEWNRFFEAQVELSEDKSVYKNVTLTSLGEAELSQINLYGIEINTEDDIARDDYVPTTLFNSNNHKASLLHRILEKAPHYSIGHVDSSISGIQRTFSFDEKSIYKAFLEISEEEGVLFDFHCYQDNNGKLQRVIDVYDLESVCLDCGNRGEFDSACDSCGSTNISHGYGNDTTISVSVENLAEEIHYETNIGAVKNCFRLEAGDKLMSATIANCNPNGSRYLWYITDEVKADMSSGLVEKLDDYDDLYAYYQNAYEVEFPSELLTGYNTLIQKYSNYIDSFSTVVEPVTGYAAIMQLYYDTIDFYLLLHDSLMPEVIIPSTTASLEAAKLTTQNLSPVAVASLTNCTAATATNAVLAMAKTVVDPRYQVKVTESTYSNGSWTGTFAVTSYSDGEDTATASNVQITINADYESFVKQRIDKLLDNQKDDVTDIVGLFKLGLSAFTAELEKYSLVCLNSFYDACQGCIDVLIEQGIADQKTWGNRNPNLYEELYLPYYNKLLAIQYEISVRSSEIGIVVGIQSSSGTWDVYGMQPFLGSVRSTIQSSLDFEKYLGSTYLKEFQAYRREDLYKNKNYISDGLDNAALFKNALQFLAVAKKEIVKSATLQHKISAVLKNLLTMKEFAPLLDYFELGNWIRIRVDNKIYKLRLIGYDINYKDLQTINVKFSDVRYFGDAASDVESILQQASSMSSSYNYFAHQAENGQESFDKVNDWVAKGLQLTNMKIVSDADNQNITWDSHGLLCREYIPVSDEYDSKQLKIINKGLYLTDNNWRSSRAAVGNFVYYDPFDNLEKEGYGVIADTLIGNLVLSSDVGIYGSGLKVRINHNGLFMTNNTTDVVINPNDASGVFCIQNHGANDTVTKVFYVDSNGLLHIQGDGSGLDISSNTSVLVYDTAGYNISIFGYGAPNSTTYPPANYTNKYYLNQNNGYLYKSNGSSWSRVSVNGSNVVLQQKTANLQTQIAQSANEITTKVSSVDYTGNTIVSMINQTATTVSISASKINLTGYVTVSSLGASGTTTINGNRISGGTISLGGDNNGNGVLRIYNASGTEIGSWTKDGIIATTGTFSGDISWVDGQKTASISFIHGSSDGISTDLIGLVTNKGIQLTATENIGIKTGGLWFQDMTASDIHIRNDANDSWMTLKNYILDLISNS